MNLPIEIDDRCSCCETKEEHISVCQSCRSFFNKTEFAASRLGEQTGYWDELGVYCRSCSEKCKECGDYFAHGSFDKRCVCYACVVWGSGAPAKSHEYN